MRSPFARPCQPPEPVEAGRSPRRAELMLRDLEVLRLGCQATRAGDMREAGSTKGRVEAEEVRRDLRPTPALCSVCNN